jgi:TonB family protein
MSNTPQDDQHRSGAANRRLQPRRRVIALSYIDLDGANGGIILNIGEDGLEATAVGPVECGLLPRMRFQMPDSRDWVEATGEITWVGESKKVAGIHFVNLPAEIRNRIRNWVSDEASPAESGSQVTKSDEEKDHPSPSPSPQAQARSLPKFTALTAMSHGETLEAGSVSETGPKPSGPGAFPSGPVPKEAQFPLEDTHSWDPEVDTDRRHRARRRLLSLAYIDLGGNNGGIILNISEGGLVVAAASPVEDGFVPRMRFQLPGSSDWIEADGEVTWTGNSKREAGIRFVDLPPDALDRIKVWVSSEQVPAKPQAERPKQPERLRRVLEMPNMRPGRSIPIPPVSSEPIIQVRTPISALNARASATLEGATVRVGVPSTSIPVPHQLTEHEVKPGVATIEHSPRFAAPWQNWSSVVGMVIAAAFVSFLVGWFTAGRAARNKMLAALTGTTTESAERIAPEKPQVAEKAVNAPAPPAPKVETQAPVANPPVVKTNASVSSPSIINAPPSAQSNKPAPAIATPRVPPNHQLTSAQAQKPNVQSNSTSTPSVSSSSRVVSAPPQTTISVPAQPKEVASAAPNPKTSAPEPLRPIETTNKESSPPPKPVENPDVVKGSVSVSFSPYPSIRIPADLRSQMAKQGASLQIGQLISRVDPAYPDDAVKNHVEGTVKLHVIIGADGAVQNAALISGPDSLAPAAVSAARQWHYKPASVAGKAVEAEQDITFVFRLVKQPAHSN